MYLDYSPFLEKERDGGGLIAPMCSFVAFSILPLFAGKCLFVTIHCIASQKAGKALVYCQWDLPKVSIMTCLSWSRTVEMKWTVNLLQVKNSLTSLGSHKDTS